MCFPCGSAYHFFGFRSVFHPWLEDLLLRYFQGGVFARWRRNKPEPAFRISSPSPRFGRSRWSFKSGDYCRPVPKDVGTWVPTEPRMVPFPVEEMKAYPVSRLMNDLDNDITRSLDRAG